MTVQKIKLECQNWNYSKNEEIFVRELEKLGFKGVYVPFSNKKEIEKNKYNLKIIYLKNLEEVKDRIL